MGYVSSRVRRSSLSRPDGSAGRQRDCGSAGTIYVLTLAVYRFEAFLERTKEPGRGPYYAGTFWYGRPLEPHGWQPWTNQELLRLMQRQVEANGRR